MIKLLMILLLLTSCNSSKNLNYYIEPQFQVFYNEFIEDLNKYNIKLYNKNVSIKVNYGNMTYKDSLAECFLDSKTIYINKDYYNYTKTFIENDDLDDDIYYYLILKKLIYHELGHCLLNLKHSNDPNDLMYKIDNVNIFLDNPDLMLSNFFNSIK